MVKTKSEKNEFNSNLRTTSFFSNYHKLPSVIAYSPGVEELKPKKLPIPFITDSFSFSAPNKASIETASSMALSDSQKMELQLMNSFSTPLGQVGRANSMKLGFNLPRGFNQEPKQKEEIEFQELPRLRLPSFFDRGVVQTPEGSISIQSPSVDILGLKSIPEEPEETLEERASRRGLI